jgi:hypothetical protein
MIDFIIGMIIIACCVGSLYGVVYGWLTFGACLLITGFLSMSFGVGKK